MLTNHWFMIIAKLYSAFNCEWKNHFLQWSILKAQTVIFNVSNCYLSCTAGLIKVCKSDTERYCKRLSLHNNCGPTPLNALKVPTTYPQLFSSSSFVRSQFQMPWMIQTEFPPLSTEQCPLTVYSQVHCHSHSDEKNHINLSIISPNSHHGSNLLACYRQTRNFSYWM